MALRVKKEATNIRGICVTCERNPQKKGSDGRYIPYCSNCSKKKWGTAADKRYRQKERIRRQRPYLLVYDKKDHCESCGFVAAHPCQLDVDHIDGSKENVSPDNFQTLCSNCHRLKTYLNKDFLSLSSRGQA